MPAAKKAAAAAVKPTDPEPGDVVPADLEHAVRCLARAVFRRQPVDFEGEQVPEWVLDVLLDEEGAAQPEPGEDPEICLECFPNGWGAPLAADAYSAGCSHGQYTHPGRVPSEAAATVLDVDDAGDPGDDGDEAEGTAVQF